MDSIEAAPVSFLVLEPGRTLEKLVLLHHAASEGDDQRRATTARHYYDIDRLLRDDRVVAALGEIGVDILARETTQHLRAAGLPTADRPAGGFCVGGGNATLDPRYRGDWLALRSVA